MINKHLIYCRGQSLVEMSFIIALVAIASIAVLTVLGDALSDVIGGDGNNPQSGFFGAVGN